MLARMPDRSYSLE